MPCQFVPLKRTSRFSVTSTVPSALMTIVSSKCWMTSWRVPAACERGAQESAATSAKRQVARTRPVRLKPNFESEKRSTLLGGGAAEADFWRFALGRRADFEEFAGFDVEHAGDDVRRELNNFRVEVANDGVVIAARVLNTVLNLAERLLKLREALNRAKLRIGFGERENLSKRGGERSLGFRFCSR